MTSLIIREFPNDDSEWPVKVTAPSISTTATQATMYSTTNAYSTNPYSTNPYDPSESPNSENNYESNIAYCECFNRKI